MSDLTGIEQLPQPDPRGWLAMRYLPPDLQNAEDSTAVCDRDRYQPRGFTRAATDAERTLLAHLGHELPGELLTHVSWPSDAVRCRRWPQLLEAQEVTAP